MQLRAFFLLFFCAAAIQAIDHQNFIDFQYKQEGSNIVLTCEPSPLVSYEDIKDKRFDLNKSMMEISLDAPMRQIAFLLRTLSNNTSVLMKAGNNLDVLSIPFRLRVRKINGDTLHEKEYFVKIGMTKEHGYIKYDDETMSVFPDKLTEPGEYRQFLKKVVFPFGSYTFPLPSETKFVVDLHFTWPKLLVKEDDIPIFDLFPSAILWNKGEITKIEIFLGSAYFWKNENQTFEMASGSALHLYAAAHEQHRQAVDLAPLDEPTEEQIGLYEEVIQHFPMDRKALERLMNAYLYHDMEDEAAALISGMQPIFSVIKKGLEHQEALHERADRKRNFLLGRKQFFERAKDARVEILSPAPNDLITGLSDLTFSLEGAPSPVLAAYCYLDNELIGTLEKEPWKIRFKAGSKRAVLPIKVMVYFENETFTEKEIDIRTMKVDQQLSVHLVPLRVVVSKGGTGFMTDLKAEDFLIKENGVDKEVAHFSSERAPLRIAVLLDTSISMTGEKMDRAQYALYEFISSMTAEDRVSFYTFDHKVMRLTDFTNDYETMSKIIFNTCPQLTTTLNDACLAGIQALDNQSGTRILLILSDGTDSGSISLDRHVAQALQASDVMVYSVVLPGSWAGQSNAQGNMFLRDLAKMTGSVSTRLMRVKGLDGAMQKIVEEFRSFYYLGYYSEIPPQQKRELKIDVKGFRAKVRHRVLQP